MSTGMYDYYFDDSITYKSRDSSKFFGLSIILHTCLAIAALFVTVPVLEKINTPVTIEFEVLKEEPIPPKPIQIQEVHGEKVKPTRGGKVAFAPAASAPLNATDSDIISGRTKTSKTSKAKIAALKTKTSGGIVKSAAYTPSRAGVPETLEDIPAPKLDFDGVAAEQVGNLGDDEFENEFKNIDHANDAAIRAEKSRLDQEAKLIADQNDSALKSLENKIEADARAMQDSLNATRTKNAAAMAQVKADEQAAADKAAREESDRLKAMAAARTRGTGDEGQGRGSSGANEKAVSAAGIPKGIRSIDQLRQMPGNPKPSYSVDERLNRQQGRVTFHAFVTPDGRLTNFKLLTSTGYKNLDGKTLAALKRWRFYPGQQGWVEIPQIWTLKGDAQPMPTLLRRQVSQR